MFELKSADELTKIVNDWISGGMQDGDGTTRGGPSSDDNETTTTTASSSKTSTVQNTAPKKTGNYSSIDDAFEDLMGD